MSFIFVCGFIGSGKTTYAKKLTATRQAFRFSIDEWMIPLYGEHMERKDFDGRSAALQKLFSDAALRLHQLGVPVIFDYGLWKRSDRQSMLEWAASHDIPAEIHFLDTTFSTCRQRALKRNDHLAGKSYEITDEMLDLFWSWFEAPSADEKAVVRIHGVGS